MTIAAFFAAMAACLLIMTVGSVRGSRRTQGRRRRELRSAAVLQATGTVLLGTLAIITGSSAPPSLNVTMTLPNAAVELGIFAVISLAWFAFQFRPGRRTNAVRDEQQEARRNSQLHGAR